MKVFLGIVAVINLIIAHVLEAVSGIAIPTQIALLVIKGCGVASFAELSWGDPLLWIPIIFLVCAAPIIFGSIFVGRFVESYLDE